MSLNGTVRLHKRLAIAAVCGIAFGILLPEAWGNLVRVVAAWNLTATLYLVLAGWMMFRCNEAGIRRRTSIQDEPGWIILAVSAGAAMVSLGAITGLLVGFKDLPHHLKPAYLGLAIYAIFCSWFFLHILFTLHYAHEYYRSNAKTKGGTHGGLQFAGNPAMPLYFDFAYYSFTIGMTAQTSDTAVTTPIMRRLTLGHAILTFFFNTVILALTINIAASLL